MIMINLFSIFDPSSSNIFSINWLRIIYVLLFIPLYYWFIPSRYICLFLLLFNSLVNEFKVLLNLNLNKINLLIFISLFIIIILNNFMGIFNYIFTASRHLVVRLSLSLILWIRFIIYGWINYINNIFIHLVPIGTPYILIPFIVLIEIISNIIRPGTLAVRLTANIIAGHLLITLISSTGNNLSLILLILILLVQSLLILLELRVRIIQAYVFTILSRLYRIESN